MELFPQIPADWLNPALGAKWERVRRVRRVVTGALELERKEKRIGSSLQAAPVVYVTAADHKALEGLDLAELAITSDCVLKQAAVPEGAFTLAEIDGVGVIPGLATGDRCERCWQVLPTVDPIEGLCPRCADAVQRLAA